MIRNIVFDMGKVLVDYSGMPVCRHFTDNEALAKRICTAVFDSPEWVLLDMGVIKEKDGIEKMISRLDTEEEKELAVKCFDHWHEYNMTARPEMGDLIRDLKAKGYGIYLCSNASVRLLTCYKKVLPSIDCFDGILFSAEVLCMKPQKEMYGHFFDRFGLKPEECYFIDDLQNNIEGAKACGMDGYCFADGDVGKLKETLYGSVLSLTK